MPRLGKISALDGRYQAQSCRLDFKYLYLRMAATGRLPKIEVRALRVLGPSFRPRPTAAAQHRRDSAAAFKSDNGRLSYPHRTAKTGLRGHWSPLASWSVAQSIYLLILEMV